MATTAPETLQPTSVAPVEAWLKDRQQRPPSAHELAVYIRWKNAQGEPGEALAVVSLRLAILVLAGEG